jgi:hypothetical protein
MQNADGLKPPEFLLDGRALPIEGVSTQTTLLDVQRARWRIVKRGRLR